MLVSKFMQVLSNLFGLNKKINASDVAVKDSKGKAENLKTYLNNSLKGTIIFQEKSWNNMKKSLEIIESDFSSYKYIDVYFCSNGFLGGDADGGNAINDVLRINLTQPSMNPTLMYKSIDWRYGNSRWYPDAQFFIGVTRDPGFFIEAVFVNDSKNKLLIGKMGYYVITAGTFEMIYSDVYYRVCKIIGYKE